MTKSKEAKSDEVGMADFEKSVQQLEKIVAKLESGEASLEESIKSYEEGVKLYKTCQTILGQAERKIVDLNALLLEEK